MAEKNCVLIITSSIDFTVDYIIKKFCNIVNFYRLNVDKFSDYEIIIGGINQWEIRNLISKQFIKREEVFSIYYRKPRLPSLNDYEFSYQNMIAKDIIAVINGLVDDFDGKVLTKPCILRKTENKIYQLIYAERNGWMIPNSYIGNSNVKATELLKEKAIIKPISMGKLVCGDSIEIYQTNYFNEFDEDISLTPVYLQQYITKQYEVRMTWINDHVYPVKIDSKDKLDWRKDYSGHSYSMIECPTFIMDKCRSMMSDFELKFGAFDFIVNENDEWVFLEVNPNGQWQWLEQALNLQISKKIVEYLIS